MFKLPQKNRQFYINSPEIFELRKYTSMVSLEDYLTDYNMKDNTKEIFAEWDRLWERARSYWEFPEIKDMKLLVDKYYKKTLCQ